MSHDDMKSWKSPELARHGRQAWSSPTLTRHGTVRNLTRGMGASGSDGMGMLTNMEQMMQQMMNTMMMMSDRRVKTDIQPIGKHSSGLTLYFYAYKPGFESSQAGTRYIGFMADEVQDVVPDAVVRGDDGYLRVNYQRLAAA